MQLLRAGAHEGKRISGMSFEVRRRVVLFEQDGPTGCRKNIVQVFNASSPKTDDIQSIDRPTARQ